MMSMTRFNAELYEQTLTLVGDENALKVVREAFNAVVSAHVSWHGLEFHDMHAMFWRNGKWLEIQAEHALGESFADAMQKVKDREKITTEIPRELTQFSAVLVFIRLGRDVPLSSTRAAAGLYLQTCVPYNGYYQICDLDDRPAQSNAAVELLALFV
jgi:hypothetical protein